MSATDQALKAWFELVVIPRCNALGLPVPPLPELFRQLVADDMTVFVQDIYSPNALANESAWDADVRRVHGSFASICQIARRDAGDLNLMTLAHRKIVSESNRRRQAAGTLCLIPHNADPDLQAFDTNLLAYINFTDGEIDAQPKKGSKLHVWKQHQLKNIEKKAISIWSCTLPGFPKFLFREDLVDDAVHVYDSKPAATSEDNCALHDDTDDEAGYNGSDKDNDDDDPTTDDTDDDEPATAKKAKIVSSSKSTIASSTAKKQKSMMDFFRSSNIISPPGAPSDEALEDNSLPRSLFNE